MTPIDAGEYKSAVGLKDLYIAEVTEDSLDAYTAGTPAYFAPAVTATSEAAVNRKTQYADDQAFEASSSEGETKVTLEVTNIPLSILASITGRVFDSATKQLWDNGGTPPYYALGFKSKKSNGSYRYFWYQKGRFDMPSDDMASQSDTPDPKTTKIVFTALKTVHQFDLGSVDDGVKRVIIDEDVSGASVATWFDDVVTPPEIAS
jgi:phi13 family phage major tail protein